MTTFSSTTTLASRWMAAALLAGAAAGAAAHGVSVKDGWVRASVPGQMATGAFMTITAPEPMRLVGIESPVAGIAEVHEMKMEGDVMKMRAVRGGLELPAGKAVELKSGGFHVMLMDLKAALPKGSSVPLTLVLRNTKGTESRIALTLPVAVTPAPAGHGHKH